MKVLYTCNIIRVMRCESGGHLVPYHMKQGESNLASSLFIYLFICINRGPHARHRNFGPGK